MNQARDLALGVFADLRERKLLPVAALLLVLVLVAPVMLHKSADTPAASATPTARSAPATVNGLPGPEQALQGKPLVTLVTLAKPSNLQTFKGRNPFKPLKPIASADSSQGSTAAPGAAAAAATSGSPSTPSASGGAPPTAGGGSGGPTGSTPTGGGPPSGGGVAPVTGKPVVRKYTYVLDGTLKTPNGTRKLKDLDRLSLLPDPGNGLLFFLGVTSDGANALFTFDAKKLQGVGGGGAHCRPSKGRCTAVWFQEGDTYRWVDTAGGKYSLSVSNIKSILVSDLKKINDARQKKAKTASGSAPGAGATGELFPMLVDLVTSTR